MRVSAPLLALVIVACGSDADDDGDLLTNAEEEDLGTDPSNPDSDGDGLNDGTEVNQVGTDPLNADTDGDRYDDGSEQDAGTDPNDAESVIYQGGWPYDPDKDRFGDPDSEAAVSGAALPRATYLDQYGDALDLYDFAGRGRWLVITLGGLNCSKCFQVASHVNGLASSLTSAEKAATACVSADVKKGDITWITAIYANAQGTKASAEDLATWTNLYPNPSVPVILDADLNLRNWMSPRDTPAFVVVDPETMLVSVGATVNITDLSPICP